ncbi:hypothetical protein Tco_0140245 [Tanacetum coccineum]
MTKSSTEELFTPFKEPKRVFHSIRKLFKTTSLDYSSSPEFDLFSDLEDQCEEEVTEAIGEPTMEEYIMKTREDYRSGIARPKTDEKAHFELKGQFLKELHDNNFSGSDNDDANEHIENVLKIVDLFHIPDCSDFSLGLLVEFFGLWKLGSPLDTVVERLMLDVLSPNGDALWKCILKGPYTPTIVTTPAVPATENSPAVPEQTTVETVMNMTPKNRAHFESEKEAIHLILTGIGDEIYSTVDACQTAQEMWEAIERLQQGESLNIQDVKTNLFWEFGQFTSHDGETIESYYTRFYKMMNEMIRNNLTVATMQVNVQFLQQLQPEWSRFVTIVKQQHKLDEVSYHKLFDILKQYQKEVNELRAERMAKNANPLALVATAQTLQDPYYQTSKPHKSYAPTSKASLPTRSHATTRYKGKEIAKPITPPSESASEEDSDPEQAQKDKDMQKNLALIAKYFKKLYKPTNNNLRTSSNTRNKNVDTTPRWTSSATVWDNQCFNSKELGHYQSEWLADPMKRMKNRVGSTLQITMAKIQEVPNADSRTDTEPLEKNDSFAFVHELKQEMHADLKYVESLEDELDEHESDKQRFSNNLKKLIEKCKGKSVDTKFDKPSVVRQPNAQRIPKPSVSGKPTPFSDSLKRKYFAKKKLVLKTNESEGLSKPVTPQNLPQTAKQAIRNTNVIKPGINELQENIVFNFRIMSLWFPSFERHVTVRTKKPNVFVYNSSYSMLNSGLHKAHTGNLSRCAIFVENYLVPFVFEMIKFDPNSWLWRFWFKEISQSKVYNLNVSNQTIIFSSSVGQFCDAEFGEKSSSIPSVSWLKQSPNSNMAYGHPKTFSISTSTTSTYYQETDVVIGLRKTEVYQGSTIVIPSCEDE